MASTAVRTFIRCAECGQIYVGVALDAGVQPIGTSSCSGCQSTQFVVYES